MGEHAALDNGRGEASKMPIIGEQTPDAGAGRGDMHVEPQLVATTDVSDAYLVDLERASWQRREEQRGQRATCGASRAYLNSPWRR